MSDYTDGLGIWRKLGVISPVVKDWNLFESAGRSTVFRAYFEMVGAESWKTYQFQYYQQSWVQIEPRYMDDNGNTFTTVGRRTSITPTPQTQLISIYLDRHLDDNLFVNRKIAVRKLNYKRNRYLGDPNVLIPYSLELHALLPS